MMRIMRMIMEMILMIIHLFIANNWIVRILWSSLIFSAWYSPNWYRPKSLLKQAKKVAASDFLLLTPIAAACSMRDSHRPHESCKLMVADEFRMIAE